MEEGFMHNVWSILISFSWIIKLGLEGWTCASGRKSNKWKMKESVEINSFKELKINRRLLEEFMERLYEGKRYIEVS